MRRQALFLALCLFSAGAAAAEQADDREHIRSMAGCFDVTYYFHEDGEHDYLAEDKPPSITRYDRLARNFLSAVAIAAIILWWI